ncbi:hypothetical protein M8C21_031900 [Ambrosia artemisiifolia]|uniref:Uncharacterized protein n=1 Tax=Ambrosia artemisiifolia TaxID=4212 RepID=A0AAD5CYK5_AMBAR|nr:hypothetical protein M8C21_031900 [Ambrosia artemisiifolia]
MLVVMLEVDVSDSERLEVHVSDSERLVLVIMPESGAKSHVVDNGKTVQSAWLTHWTGARPETSKHDHLTQISRSESNDLHDHDFKNHTSGVEMASDNFGYSKGIKDVDLTMSLVKPSSQSFAFFKRGQESGKSKEGVPELGPQVPDEKLTLDFNLESSSRECHPQPTEQVKYHMFFGESSYKPDNHTSHEPENFRHMSAAFASKPKTEKSEMPSFLRHNNAAVLKTDPSTSSHHSHALIEEQYKRMQKHIGMGFFPRQTGSPQHSNPQTLHHGQYSLQNVPHFVQDVEMTGMPGGLHCFSRTTHSLLITKQTDVKVYQESQFFRESRASTQLKGEVFKELNFSHPRFGQSQQGVKLQLLDSSDHESQENVEASGEVQKNESSADTDTMDMESYKENHLSGAHLSTPNKDIMVESNIEKDKHRKRKIELPDINLEVPAQPAASSSAEKAEPGTSRTQRSRWIKRLKLTETPSHGRLSRFFTTVRVMEGEPEPMLDKHHGKRPESLTGDSSSVETKRDSKEIKLAHSWIQRWSHRQNQKNLESAGTCQLDDSKLEMEELEKKQFPSIAAMALMGKAMTGFRQFKLQKRESFVVWNTKALE